MGYFPANKPEYSCIVVIHRPNKRLGYYGSTVAAPVFKKIAKKIYTATPRNVHIDLDQLKSLSPVIVENNLENEH